MYFFQDEWEKIKKNPLFSEREEVGGALLYIDKCISFLTPLFQM